ncbi:MAG TPA: MBL fold metallo-hydrolase [Acidimicrobiales bacterium]|nr:MBL fold metallo-hydrolase [Acidimicrobiales bacterium]
MRIQVCGVRGSTPAPGAEFVRYGGHTSCVVVSHDGQLPSLIIDAGTGIRRASGLLDNRPFEGSIVLGHMHWDHTQGLPFFAAADVPDARVNLYVPAQGDTEELVARFMSPPHFPISPSDLRGHWSFSALDPGETTLEGFSVLALEIPHKGGRTFGYRISDGGSTFAYLSDHWPTSLGQGPEGLGEYHEGAMDLVRDCDLLFHDAQYTDDELAAKGHLGHAAVGYCVGLASRGGVRRLLLFHHDPSRTDEEIDAIVESHQRGPVTVEAAFQGMAIDL